MQISEALHRLVRVPFSSVQSRHLENRKEFLIGNTF